MIVFVLPFFAVLLWLAWKSGVAELISDEVSDFAARWGLYLKHESGAWADLPERLQYRDFHRDVVETAEGWMFAPTELRPIATDGFSHADWNALYDRINRAIIAMGDRTCIQVMLRADHSPEEGLRVFRRLLNHCPILALKPVIESRAKHLKGEAAAARVVRHRLYAFIGRQRTPVTHRVPLRGLLNSSPWVDLERDDFLALRQETLRARDQFIGAFTAIGGWARPLPVKEVFAIAYERLNPGRARRHPAPRYDFKLGSSTTSSAGGNGSTNGHSPDLSVDNLDHALDEAFARLQGALRAPAKKGPALKEISSTAELFADSPRETLCLTPLRVCGDHFVIGDVPVMTISLHRLPTKTFAGLMEVLTRQAGINFPYEISTTFTVGDTQEWDERFERMLTRARINILRSNNPNQDEELKRDEVHNLRESLKKGEEKVGEVSFTITFTAPNTDELQRRRDIFLIVLRQMDSMEGVAEPSVPIDPFLASLPCAPPHTDFRRRPILSHNAIGLMTLTGAAAGVPEHEATDVFQRADGGLFYWNPRSQMFSSGMAAFCGLSGSGKSAAVSRQRTVLLASGHRGVTLDFGGSAYRLCQAVGGEYIEITDPRRSRGLGLFDIRPKPDELYLHEELSPEGLPLDRLAHVSMLLEVLTLDPTKPHEVALEPEYKSLLDDIIKVTYENLLDEVPTTDDFIWQLSRAPKNKREMGERLAARLKVFAGSSALQRFLNDRSEPISIDNPYTVFDFRGTNPNEDARLILVASMAVTSYINRLLRVGRHVPKFVDVDEFNVISKNRLICRAIDQAMRTARKLNAVCSVVSQDPADFEYSEEAKGVRANCEVFWLFNLPRLEYAQQILELSDGMVKLLQKIQVTATADYRDCVLKYPGGAVHLRLRNGPLDRRLLLGAGRETATLDEALNDVGLPLTESLIKALTVDGLGADLPRQKIFSSVR